MGQRTAFKHSAAHPKRGVAHLWHWLCSSIWWPSRPKWCLLGGASFPLHHIWLGQVKNICQKPQTMKWNVFCTIFIKAFSSFEPTFCIIHQLLFIVFRFELENETSFTTKKGRGVDNSIMRAYTEAIRRAKRFIYIENQYFMGSAHAWLDEQDVHCYNVIPMEITQQICEAITEGRR